MRNLPPPSRMVRKFMADDNMTNEERNAYFAELDTADGCEDGWPQDPIRDEKCFFYGSLMDPQTLSQVLKSFKSPPIMRRARVRGFRTKLWGPYPAFIEGQKFDFVDGMVICEPLSPKELDRLDAYETDKYRRRSCLIEVLHNGGIIKETIEGITFEWNGQLDELQEGAFDLAQWKKERQLQDLD